MGREANATGCKEKESPSTHDQFTVQMFFVNRTAKRIFPFGCLQFRYKFFFTGL
jgi:hypothetical protein